MIPASSFTETMLEHHKVIIVGQGELSFHYLLFMQESQNVFGLKIAANWSCDTYLKNLLILHAAHIPASQESSDTFKRFYHLAASDRYREPGCSYGIPFRYGERDNFQDYQYDLLFLISRPYISGLIGYRSSLQRKTDTANQSAENNQLSPDDETTRTIYNPVCQQALDLLESFYMKDAEAVIYCNTTFHNRMTQPRLEHSLQFCLSEILGYRVKLRFITLDKKLVETIKPFNIHDKTCQLAVDWWKTEQKKMPTVVIYCNSEFYRLGSMRDNAELLQRCFRRILGYPLYLRLRTQE